MRKRLKMKGFPIGSIILGKKGQFFLITTIVIVGIIVSWATLSNYTRNIETSKFYYLGEILDYESQQVVDYGIANDLDMNGILINFTHEYSQYSEADNMYFLFGDETKITVAGYKKTEDGSVEIYQDGGETSRQELNVPEGQYSHVNISSPSGDIRIVADGSEYDFSLNQGTNFRFIISREVAENKQVYVS